MSEGIVKINKQGFFQINDLEFGKETLVMKYNMLLRENTKLKTQLKEAEKVIDYYGDEVHWYDSDATGEEQRIANSIEFSDITDMRKSRCCGGKKAREYKTKYKIL